jgi:DNA-binding MarR family transcriptional regulator
MANTDVEAHSTDLEANIGFIISDLARLMKTGFDRRIKTMGLTRAQWLLLAHLYRADGLTQTELAETVDLERATVGKTLDRLEESDWVYRKNDATDRRVKRIYLTQKFGPYVQELQNNSHDLISEAFGHLSDKKFAQLVDDLRTARSKLLEQL